MAKLNIWWWPWSWFSQVCSRLLVWLQNVELNSCYAPSCGLLDFNRTAYRTAHYGNWTSAGMPSRTQYISIQRFVMAPALAIARARLPLYFTAVIFIYFIFFSRHTFLDVGKPTYPKLSHTTWISIQQNLAIAISSKCPLKRTGAEKNKICKVAYI